MCLCDHGKVISPSPTASVRVGDVTGRLEMVFRVAFTMKAFWAGDARQQITLSIWGIMANSRSLSRESGLGGFSMQASVVPSITTTL